MSSHFLVLGVIWYIAFLFSTACHEAAHAIAAHLGGDSTALQRGQATLNPLPHIRREPYGTVVVPIISYLLAHWMVGWASAPFDPAWQDRHPRRAALMALAGPLANFSLVALSSLAIHLGIASGIFLRPSEVGLTHVASAAAAGNAELAATFLSILFVLNLLLGTFNLLPTPPLDGGTGIILFLPENLGRSFLNFTRQGFGMAGLLLGWVLYDKMFPYIFRVGLAILYPGTHWG